MTMERWRGRTAVVTGAGGGIGGAIATKLVGEGLRVVGIDVHVPTKDTTVNKIFLRCDITDVTELAEAFKTIEETYGGVDIMVNCAGYAKSGHITSAGTDQISDADVAKIVDVNVKAMIFCSRYAVDSMKKRCVNGHIVNINSIAGHYVAFSDLFNIYSCSKHAVTAFTQSLFYELSTFKNRIKVTSISPGLVQTAMSGDTVKDFTAVPALQPSDVADAVVYVLSSPPHVNISELTVQPVGDLRM